MQDRFKFRTYIPDRKFFKFWGWIKKGEYKGLCPTGEYSLDELLEKYTNQCTGLKDKNGKLIYEGDVVTYEWLTPLGKVWRNDGKYIVEWSDGFCLLSNIARYDVEHGTKRNVEIIGNIYENPELLESEVE